MVRPLHPYLRSIEFGNIRCFAEAQRVDFTAPGSDLPARFTLVLGENGCGKSTLLQLLALLRPDDEHSLDVPKGRRVWTHATGAESLRLTGLPRIEHNADVLIKYGCATALREPSPFPLNFGVNLRTYGASVTRNVVLTEEQRFKTLTVGYGPNRLPGRATLSAERVGDSVEALFSSSAALINPEEWFLQQDYLANNARQRKAERARAAAQRDRVGALLCSVLPDVRELVPGSVHRVGGGEAPALFAETPLGRVRVSELGFGYQTTLAWVVDLATRMMAAYPESDAPLAEPAVVLIDEIDLHLHPKWQRTLLAELAARFPNVQFVATAHSPLVVQAAPDANVVVLRREADRVVVDQRPRDPSLWRVDQILTSDLFGLPSARAPALDGPLARRNALLAKPALTAADEAELARLRAEIGDLPGGDTPWEMEAMELIRRAASSLRDAPTPSGVRDGAVATAYVRRLPAKATGPKESASPRPAAKPRRARRKP